MLILNHRIQMIKAKIATCEFILLHVIEFKYIRHGIILRSIILYLKICQVDLCDNYPSFFQLWILQQKSKILYKRNVIK